MYRKMDASPWRVTHHVKMRQSARPIGVQRSTNHISMREKNGVVLCGGTARPGPTVAVFRAKHDAWTDWMVNGETIRRHPPPPLRQAPLRPSSPSPSRQAPHRVGGHCPPWQWLVTIQPRLKPRMRSNRAASAHCRWRAWVRLTAALLRNRQRHRSGTVTDRSEGVPFRFSRFFIFPCFSIFHFSDQFFH